VNYFDVAPTYGDAEEKLGPALAPHRREVFLACKNHATPGRRGDGELERSLKRLQTDHFDLYQLHAVTTTEDVETISGPGGAMEAFVAARQAGKVRFLGFSAHSVEAALALLERFRFRLDPVPIQRGHLARRNFGPQVLAKAKEQGVGILALKAIGERSVAGGRHPRLPKCWYEPLSEPAEARLGLRFTLSHPITAAVPPGDENLFRLALNLAKDLPPLSDAERPRSRRRR